MKHVAYNFQENHTGQLVFYNRLANGSMDSSRRYDDPSFSLPGVLCDPIDLIWRKGTPFDAMTGRTAPSSDGLLAGVFLGYKANARRSLHSPQDHSIITLIISNRRD